MAGRAILRPRFGGDSLASDFCAKRLPSHATGALAVDTEPENTNCQVPGLSGKLASGIRGLGKRHVVQLIDILMEEQVVSAEELERVLQYQASHGGALAELLIRGGLVGEDDLFFLMSRKLDRQPLADDALANLTVTEELKRRVPAALAWQCVICPLEVDVPGGSITVAMCDPTDDEVLRRLKVASRVDSVRACLARRSAILEVVRQHWNVADLTDRVIPPDAFAAPQATAPGAAMAEQEPEPPAEPDDHVADEFSADATMVGTPSLASESDADERSVSYAEGALLEEMLEGVGVLISMLEERIDPGGAMAREYARLTRLVGREMALSSQAIAALAVAAHLYGLDIALRKELGNETVSVGSAFAEVATGDGGLSASLRTLARRLVTFAEIGSDDNQQASGEAVIAMVSEYVELRREVPQQSNDPETLMQLLRTGHTAPAALSALLRVVEIEEPIEATDRHELFEAALVEETA